MPPPSPCPPPPRCPARLSLGPLSCPLPHCPDQRSAFNQGRGSLVHAGGGEGEGRRPEVTFLRFLQETFTHHQLPGCPSSWPPGRRNTGHFLAAGGARAEPWLGRGKAACQSPGLPSRAAHGWPWAGVVPATCVDHLLRLVGGGKGCLPSLEVCTCEGRRRGEERGVGEKGVGRGEECTARVAGLTSAPHSPAPRVC